MKGITITENAVKKEIVPAGTHVARCYQMIHIGTIEWEYQGEKKFTNKIRLSFELPNELRDYGAMSISQEYTMSLHEKSNLRRDLQAWMGRELYPGELKEFDITEMIGHPVLLSIIHKTSNAGHEFAAISSFSSMMEGVECPPQLNESFIFNYHDNFNLDWLNNQPEWLQEQIKSTDEYKSKMM